MGPSGGSATGSGLPVSLAVHCVQSSSTDLAGRRQSPEQLLSGARIPTGTDLARCLHLWWGQTIGIIACLAQQHALAPNPRSRPFIRSKTQTKTAIGSEGGLIAGARLVRATGLMPSPRICIGPAGQHGVVWHYSRPPIVSIEYEMDLFGGTRETVIQTFGMTANPPFCFRC